MRNALCIGVVIVCFLLPLGAMEAYPQSLGVQGGRIAGIGASYQIWTDTFGYQVAGGLITSPDMENGRDSLAYNLGFELQYPFVSHTVNPWLSGKLYLVGGLHHMGYKEAILQSDDTYLAGPLNLNVGAGAGIGVETILFSHFAIGTEFVYFGMYSLTDHTLIIDMQPQVSVRYRF
ncbi:hypothetical protein [Sphaerochaeta sp.]|uniref:hypothetical protein n=1 Tax=Sphaerochaeta sp. TaxID=1972642 RepID=UPI002FC96DA1